MDKPELIDLIKKRNNYIYATSYSKPNLEDLYLSHHGIKGMKWGVRRTPEQLGHKRGQKNTKSRENDRIGFGMMSLARFGISSAYNLGEKASQKLKNEGRYEEANVVDAGLYRLNRTRVVDLNIGKEIASGVVAAAMLPVNPVGAAAVGGIAAACMANRIKNAARSAIRTVEYKQERDNAAIDKKTGLKLKSSDLDEKEDMKRVNPMYGDALKGSKNNCMACSMAYDMRRRGFEVRAKKLNFGLKNSDMLKYYKNAEYSGDMSTRKAFVLLKQQPDGSRGAVTVHWTMGGGHSMGYEVKGGKVTIIDSQTSKRYSEAAFRSQALLGVTSMGYTRLDNCTPNYEALRKDILE